MWWMMVVAVAVPLQGDGPSLQGPYPQDECLSRAREWNAAYRLPINGAEYRALCLTAHELQIWRARLTPPSTRNRG